MRTRALAGLVGGCPFSRRVEDVSVDARSGREERARAEVFVRLFKKLGETLGPGEFNWLMARGIVEQTKEDLGKTGVL